MLNIKQVESTNECVITGTLNELEIVEDKTKDGRAYIRGTAKIKVDQEIEGKLVENIIPVSMFSMRLKKDGTENKVYDRILGYKNNLISAAAAETPAQASKITIAGKACNITENMWVDKTTGNVRTGGFSINSNFLNAKKDSDKEQAIFEMTGVVLGKRDEMQNDEPTGRLIISFGVITYGGKINVIDLYAADSAKAYIETNWNDGETVKAIGVINSSSKVIEWEEEVGFGEPIKRQRTQSRRELIITAGSPNGFEESLSYDADDVKAALAERKGRIEEMKNNASNAAKPKSSSDFGF